MCRHNKQLIGFCIIGGPGVLVMAFKTFEDPMYVVTALAIGLVVALPILIAKYKNWRLELDFYRKYGKERRK